MKHWLVVTFIFVASLVRSQIPGHWLKTPVCSSCKPSSFLAYADEQRGIIFTEPQGPETVEHAFRTTNDGRDWTELIDSAVHFSIQFYTPLPSLYTTEGFAVGLTGGWVIFSTDDGITWQHREVPPAPNGREMSIAESFAHSPSALFFLATESYDTTRLTLYITRDLGQTYEQTDFRLSKDKRYWNAAFVDSSEFWASYVDTAQLGRVWRKQDSVLVKHFRHTTDQGKNWTEVQLPDILNVNFNVQEIVSGFNKGTIFLRNYTYPDTSHIGLVYTQDYGQTWTIDSTINAYIYAIFNPSPTKLWGYLNDQRTVIYSSDLGTTWSVDTSTFRNERIRSMHWLDSTRGYILTHSKPYDKGTLDFYKYSLGTGLVRTFSSASSTLQPKLVYDELTFDTPLEENYEVYDVLGKKVLQGEIPTHATHYAIDISTLPEGLYHLCSRTNGNVFAMRFMKVR